MLFLFSSFPFAFSHDFLYWQAVDITDSVYLCLRIDLLRSELAWQPLAGVASSSQRTGYQEPTRKIVLIQILSEVRSGFCSSP